MYKKFFSAFLLVCVLATAAMAAAPDQTPMDRVKQAAGELIELLSDPAIKHPENYEASLAKMRATAEKYIDFRLVTMMAVGRPWLKMSPKMQTDLTEAFIKLLERTYLKRIPVYEGQKVVYKKEAVSGNKAKVSTEIIDKDKKIVVEFRLKLVQETWMVYDVVAEGVSLVANYRSQFSGVLSNGTPEELLEMINTRIEKLDKGEDDGEQNQS